MPDGTRCRRSLLPFVAIALLLAAPAAHACPECPVLTETFPAGGNAFRFEIADFTGDGIPDLVVGEPNGFWGSGGIRLLKGAHAANDTGYVLLPPQAIASGDFPDFGFGDFDHDGHLDLAVADRSGHQLHILRGHAGGTFTAGPNYPLDDYVVTVNVVDVDLDGILDVVTAAGADYSTVYFKGDGSNGVGEGTFTMLNGPGDTPHPAASAFGDFNHDGVLDAVVISTGDSSIAIFKGGGTLGHWNGTWGPSSRFHLLDTATYVRVADIDADGNPDILACTYSGVGRILFGRGTGTGVADFTDWGHQFHGKSPLGLADFTRDGRRTFVIADPGEFFDISGTVATRRLTDDDDVTTTVGTTGHPVSAGVADLDGDGVDDMVAVSYESSAITVQLQRCRSLAPLAAPGSGWVTDGVKLTNAGGAKDAPVVCPDGAGGAYVAWADRRTGNANVVAQHLGAGGTFDPKWTSGGVVLKPRVSDQTSPAIAFDAARGAFVTWDETTPAQGRGIYGVNVLVDGQVPFAWSTALGDSLPLGPGLAGAFTVAGDGRRSLFQCWTGAGNDLDWTRVRATSVHAAPLVLSAEPGAKANPQVVPDPQGGFYAVWQQVGTPGGDDIFAIHYRRDGSRVAGWSDHGNRICGAAGVQGSPAAALDAAGGLTIAWEDSRGATKKIYAQHVDSNGVASGPANGWAVSARGFAQDAPRMAAAGGGEAFVLWHDAEGAGDLWVQRVATGGTAAGWPADGRVLCNAAGDQAAAQMVADGAGGGIVAWQDFRGADADIFAIQFGPDGALPAGWNANGTSLCTAAGVQSSPRLALVSPGQAIAVWSDARSGTPVPYAGRAGAYSTLGVTDPPARAAFAIDRLSPNPSRRAFTVDFTLPAAAPASVEMLDVQGRRLLHRDLGVLPAGRHSASLAPDARLAPGVYLVRVTWAGQSRVARVALIH